MRRPDMAAVLRTGLFVSAAVLVVATAGRPAHSIAADRLPDEAKRAALAPQVFSPSLGLSRQEVLNSAGKPVESVMLPSGIESLRFKSASGRCYVEISPETGKAIQIYYFKSAPFTAAEKDDILARNSRTSSLKFKSREGSLDTKEFGKEFLLAVLADTKRGR